MQDVAETVRCRLATEADLTAVDALLARSYARLLRSDYPPSVQVTVLPRLARAQPRLLGSGRYWVAMLADCAIVGAGGWSARGPGEAEVRHFVTDARHVRRGIASTVMAHVAAQARDHGFRQLHCLATLSAVPFYMTVGFRRLDEIEVSLLPGIGFPVVRMIRDLDG